MNKRRRDYIKEHGRTQLREMTNRRTVPKAIVLDDHASLVRVKAIGSWCKVWSGIYCTWVIEGTVEVNGLVLRKEFYSFDVEEAIIWVKEKYKAMTNPRFARYLQAAINASNYTLEDIASSIGVTENSISKWISGDMYPSVVYLVRLCKMIYKEDWKDQYLLLSDILELERV